MKRRTSSADSARGGRIALIALSFMLAATAIVTYSENLVVPVFVALLTLWQKLLASLTPKVLLLFAKNSLLIRLKQIIFGTMTQMFVMSHRPWRRRVFDIRLRLLALIGAAVSRYRDSPLWLKTLFALGVLVLTAGSGYAVIAVLIVPKAIVDWLQRQFWLTLNKLGVTQFFRAAFRLLVPERLRHRWYMYRKWTLGRRQVRAHGRMRAAAARSRQTLLSRSAGDAGD